MRARVKIAQLLNFNPQGREIDDILSDLTRNAPNAAIKCFTSKSKPKPVEYPEYTEFVRLWDEKYHEIGLQMPKDGAKIKSIIRQVRDYIKKTDHDPTPENCINFWGAFVQNLKKTWAHGQTLSVIDSKLPSLIFELKHGKQKSSYQSSPSAKRIFESL